MTRPALGLGALALLGCAGLFGDEQVRAELEAARRAALAEPAPVPEDFAPDLVLHLSPELVQRLVEAGLQGRQRVSGELDAPGGIELRPDLTVRRVDVGPSRACDRCLSVDARLAGDVAYTSGIAGKGEVPLTIDAVLDLELDTRAVKGGWQVTVAPQRVRKLSVDVDGLPQALTRLAEEPLRGFVEGRLAKLDPVDLVALSGDDLPIVGLRVEPEGAGVRLAMASEAPVRGTVPLEGAATDDWTLVASPESLAALGRRESFRAGPQTPLELIGTPEGLALDGDRFTLDLRLWRTSSPAWWRDYRARGTVRVDRGRIRLVPAGVDELAASPGAELADPLAFLASGYVVDALTDALHQSVPATGATAAGGRRVEVEVRDVRGQDGQVVVSGALELGPK